MSPQQGDPGPEAATPDSPPDPSARVEAERAGARYWRDVAGQRRTEAARVQRRPLVRAAIALDRRTQRAQASVAARMAAVAQRSHRSAVTVSGWRSRGDLAARRQDLASQLATAEPSVSPWSDSVLVVHLGQAPAHPAGPNAQVVALPAGATTADINAVVAGAAAKTVCLVGPTTATVRPGWFDPLASALGGDVVAATPLVLHPERPWSQATPHDLRVRWAGLDVIVDPDGTPRLVGRKAGQRPDLTAPPETVAAASGTALVIGRDAWTGAAGLDPDLPYDTAVVDFSIRLQETGATIVVVPAGAVLDERPVTSQADLIGPHAPADAGWKTVVEHHGPRMVADASPQRSTAITTVALTMATPSRKLAAWSGDWHYGGLFAAALRRAGHQVRLQTIEEADSLAGRSCDLHIVLRGLEPVRRTQGQRHVLWIISHPEAVEPAECDDADLVLVASSRYAAHLRDLTRTPVEVMWQATDPDHFVPTAETPDHHHPVTIVANTRGVMRPAVRDAVAAGLHPAIYGQGWSGLVDPASVISTYASFDELPSVYASAGVVLNDHWETMRRWGFVSNRLFDVAACATPIVSDHLPEIDDLFDGLVPTWSDPASLAHAVETLRADPLATAQRSDQLRQIVRDRHTFDHRAAELMALLGHYGLGTLPQSRRD